MLSRALSVSGDTVGTFWRVLRTPRRCFFLSLDVIMDCVVFVCLLASFYPLSKIKPKDFISFYLNRACFADKGPLEGFTQAAYVS